MSRTPHKTTTSQYPSTTGHDTADDHNQFAGGAYFHAEHRGFEGGDPVQDWLSAEAEIHASLHTLDAPDTRLHGKRAI